MKHTLQRLCADITLLICSAVQIQGEDLTAVFQAIESTSPLPPTSAPVSGTFYSIQNGVDWPPFPADMLNQAVGDPFVTK